MLTVEQIKTMSDKDITGLLLAIEKEHDVRFGLVTRSDVNDVFQNARMAMTFGAEVDDKFPVRDMTDDEWTKFTEEWFWTKGHSEIFWDGDIMTAIQIDLEDCGLLRKDGFA